MPKEFFPALKRKPSRARFYSSMTHEQYCEIYGPPSPICKPLEDPIQDIPLFDLEAPATTDQLEEPYPGQQALNYPRMETIQQIEASQNFTIKDHVSPRLKDLPSATKLVPSADQDQQNNLPNRRGRMRSQSDNSEYLIFNFLDRVNQKGRKRVKID